MKLITGTTLFAQSHGLLALRGSAVRELPTFRQMSGHLGKIKQMIRAGVKARRLSLDGARTWLWRQSRRQGGHRDAA